MSSKRGEKGKGISAENDNEEENNSKLDELFSQMRQLSQQVQALQSDNVILQEEIKKRDAIINNNSSSSFTVNGGGMGNNSSSNKRAILLPNSMLCRFAASAAKHCP